MSAVHVQETIDRLAELAAKHLSSSQIALELGMSRCAVSGLAARNGIRLTGRWFAPKSEPKIEVVDEPPLDMAKLITFNQLKNHSCRYPIGDHDYLYCGQQKLDSHSYCAAHCRLAYRPRD